jgi:hypothetical protein
MLGCQGKEKKCWVRVGVAHLMGDPRVMERRLFKRGVYLTLVEWQEVWAGHA